MKAMKMLMVVLMMTIGSLTFGEVLLGVGEGYEDEVAVRVVKEAGKIIEIGVTYHDDTPGIADRAISKMPQRIIDKQSTDVDTVAGATYTSRGILEGVEDALSKEIK